MHRLERELPSWLAFVLHSCNYNFGFECERCDALVIKCNKGWVAHVLSNITKRNGMERRRSGMSIRFGGLHTVARHEFIVRKLSSPLARL